MAAEAARVLEYTDSIFYGSAAPAETPYVWPGQEADVPAPQERAEPRAREAARRTYQVSMFAIFGSILAGILMIFVVLAQISYNEIAGETVKLNAQLNALTEQERKLEIMFEGVIDMKDVERYARDVLGMSKPDNEQVAVIQVMQLDKAEIVHSEKDENILGEFGSFISSLMEYFK